MDFTYLYFKLKRYFLTKLDVFQHKRPLTRFGSMKILDIEDSNKYINSLINSSNPFLICRFGSSEMQVINDYFDIINLGKRGFSREKMNVLMVNSGFFGDETSFYNFSKLMLTLSESIDGLAILNRQEEYIVKKYTKNVTLLTLQGIEPYLAAINPWSQSLKGKKVLVIHPFADTIEQQYKKRKLLFSDDRILPPFDLKVIKAVQTLAGESDNRFSDWFGALNYMIEEALKIDFDIALVGCGAYGLPLAASLKEHGKQAIHMGGALQVLFGIKGQRWDNHPIISKLYNPYWVRPNENEVIKRKNDVENGCYW